MVPIFFFSIHSILSVLPLMLQRLARYFSCTHYLDQTFWKTSPLCMNHLENYLINQYDEKGSNSLHSRMKKSFPGRKWQDLTGCFVISTFYVIKGPKVGFNLKIASIRRCWSYNNSQSDTKHNSFGIFYVYFRSVSVQCAHCITITIYWILNTDSTILLFGNRHIEILVVRVFFARKLVIVVVIYW